MATETIEQFQARIAKLPDAIRKVLEQIATEGALQAEGISKEYATTRVRVRSGLLRRSIKGEVKR